MGSSEYYLTIKQLFSESVIGYLVLYCLLFLFTLAQDWINIFLFIFPIITFSFALFFKLIEVNKWRTKFEGSPIVYNPLGSEKNNANRFNVISLLLLIFLMWIGYESFVHPQLIETYIIFFMIIYFFLYTFSFFILFFDIWKYSHIKLKYDNNNGTNLKEEENYKKIVRFLKVKKFRMISYLNLGIFVILNGLNLLFSFLTYFGVIPGYSLHLPGTGIEGSQPLILPFTFFIGLIASPMYTIPLLLVIYNEINDLSIEQLENILKDFSKNMRVLILENFKILNKRLLKDLDMDEFIKTMEIRKDFREYVAQRREKSVRDEKSTGEGNGKRNLKKVNEREEESSNKQKTKKTITQKERSIEKYSSEEENIIAPKRTKKAEEKAKEIREIIKEESKKKDKKSRKTEEYHNKNIKHKKWVKKQEPGSILTIKKSKGRRTCPNCDEARKEMIHESIDKTHVIMKSPRVYGKKYKCGRCGTEWREV